MLLVPEKTGLMTGQVAQYGESDLSVAVEIDAQPQILQQLDALRQRNPR